MKTILQKKQLLGSLLFMFLSLTSMAAHAWFWESGEENASKEATQLNWGELVPKGFVPPRDLLALMPPDKLDKLLDGSPDSNLKLAEIEAKMSYAPTVPELNGKQVKIPGFVVPLDFDGQTELSEFLLVPYYGACIHTPPPPANQVILVKSSSSITVEDTYDPVWVTGELSTETVKTELAETGYSLNITAIEAYTTK